MASKGTLTRASLWLVLASTWALASGCASPPPPPELELSRMRVVAIDKPPRIDVNSLPGGKLVGAGVGAGTGSGAGVLVAGVMCLSTGPFFPLCALALVPTGGVVGAVTGGVVGAVRTESTAAIDLKTKVLHDHLEAVSYSRLLTKRLQVGLADGRAIDEPAAATAEPGGRPPWTLDVAVTEVGTEGKAEFALRLVARISLRRGDDVQPVWTIAKELQSETELTTAAWTAADARAMQVVLELCVGRAAHELLIDLTRHVEGPGNAAPQRSRRSSSCADVPAEVKASSASFAASSGNPPFQPGPVPGSPPKEAP